MKKRKKNGYGSPAKGREIKYSKEYYEWRATKVAKASTYKALKQ